MRLIDADKLIYEIENTLWDWDSVDGITSSTVLKQCISDIRNEPTVEAISIKLYEQIKGERNVAIEQLKRLNIELFENPCLKAIPIEWLLNHLLVGNKEQNTAVYNLIYLWRKENENAGSNV